MQHFVIDMKHMTSVDDVIIPNVLIANFLASFLTTNMSLFPLVLCPTTDRNQHVA